VLDSGCLKQIGAAGSWAGPGPGWPGCWGPWTGCRTQHDSGRQHPAACTHWVRAEQKGKQGSERTEVGSVLDCVCLESGAGRRSKSGQAVGVLGQVAVHHTVLVTSSQLPANRKGAKTIECQRGYRNAPYMIRLPSDGFLRSRLSEIQSNSTLPEAHQVIQVQRRGMQGLPFRLLCSSQPLLPHAYQTPTTLNHKHTPHPQSHLKRTRSIKYSADT
jgi:hypothetical protein